ATLPRRFPRRSTCFPVRSQCSVKINVPAAQCDLWCRDGRGRPSLLQLVLKLFPSLRAIRPSIYVSAFAISLTSVIADLVLSRATDGLQSGRRSIRQSLRRPADAAAAYLPASLQVARGGGAGGDHPEVGSGCAGAVPHQDCHR